MKKILLLLVISLLLCGCGKYGEKEVIRDFTKKIDKLSAYRVGGQLEITNNDEVYKYDIDVSYKKDNNYRVKLVNTANDHTQIILKNKGSVYVITPSLNKSFKFQSDWPYSNSQIYLLHSLANDIKNEKNRKFTKTKSGYEIIASVNYPNNSNLVKQKVILDDKLRIKQAIVYDKKGSIIMVMKFEKTDYAPRFKKNYFSVDTIMDDYSIDKEKTKETAVLDDSIYPLVIPTGTKLINEERVNTDGGDRIIMTFDGEKPFLLVEEAANIEDEFTIVPTYGEPYRLMDTLGVMTDNSLSWSSNGVEYYLVSDVLSQNELVEVAQSINVVQTMK